MLETLRIAPKGSTAVSDFLNAGADALVQGGETGVFTPMFFFHVRKPHASQGLAPQKLGANGPRRRRTIGPGSMGDDVARIAELARELSHTLPLEEQLQRTVDCAAAILGAPRASVRLFDAARTRLIAKCRFGEPLHPGTRRRRVPRRRGAHRLDRGAQPVAAHGRRAVGCALRPEERSRRAVRLVHRRAADERQRLLRRHLGDEPGAERVHRGARVAAVAAGRAVRAAPRDGAAGAAGGDRSAHRRLQSARARPRAARARRAHGVGGDVRSRSLQAHQRRPRPRRRRRAAPPRRAPAGVGGARRRRRRALGRRRVPASSCPASTARSRSTSSSARASSIEDDAIVVGGNVLRITISVGVAERQPGETRDALIARADEALYVAKNSGRNRVELAGASVCYQAPLALKARGHGEVLRHHLVDPDVRRGAADVPRVCVPLQALRGLSHQPARSR